MLTFIGRSVLGTLTYFGELGLLVKETLVSIVRAPIRWRLVLQQVVQIGYRSQLVASATGAFTGAVFAAQLYFQMHKFGMDSSVGSVTAVALLRELGPALGGIMVAGRCGAAIAAEIGTMKVTEQVDALRALGVNPIDYLVVPRALAMMISMPLLIAEACALGILAANFVAIEVLGIAEAGYMRNLINWVQWDDIAKALIKAFVFGCLIAFIACREGLAAENGAEGVGRAPTEAVVIASLTIIAANFVLTFALNVIFPRAMIEARGLTKSFGAKRVLCGVDLTIETGETMVILGRSGSGKSVILKHLIGLMKPESGDVLVDGESIADLPERKLTEVRRKVGMLFQSGALFDSMTVEGNLAFPLREQGLRDPKLIAERVAEALDMVDLAGEEKKMPSELSGGMRKRVGLARTIVGRPRCILYDEPTTGLDPITTDGINHMIRRLQRRLQVTSIIVTHDMKTAFHCADRVAFLHEGRNHFVGTVPELRASTDPVLCDFIEGRSGETD